MKHTEKRTEQRTYDYVTKMVCDLCGRSTPDDDNWCKGADFDTGDLYGVKETAVKLEEGTCYPEGGDKTITEFDLCPDCFKTKLIPWLESQGAKPRTHEVDW